MSAEDTERVARKMVDEAAGRAVRVAGSGGMLPGYRALAVYIEIYAGEYYGFTRRVDAYKAMPELMPCKRSSSGVLPRRGGRRA